VRHLPLEMGAAARASSPLARVGSPAKSREGSKCAVRAFLGASLRDRAKPDDNARYLAQWQAEVRVGMEKSAHWHTWIASITRILHYCEAAGLFDSNESLCPVATAPRQYDSMTREPYTLAADRKRGSAAGLV